MFDSCVLSAFALWGSLPSGQHEAVLEGVIGEAAHRCPEAPPEHACWWDLHVSWSRDLCIFSDLCFQIFSLLFLCLPCLVLYPKPSIQGTVWSVQEEKSNTMLYNTKWSQVPLEWYFSLLFEHSIQWRVSWSHPAFTLPFHLPQAAQHIFLPVRCLLFLCLKPTESNHCRLHATGYRVSSATLPMKRHSFCHQPWTPKALQIGLRPH